MTPLPEPELGYEDQSIGGVWIEGYTADQLRAYGAAEYKRGIEFAVSRCMYRSHRNDDMGAIIASDILNLVDAS